MVFSSISSVAVRDTERTRQTHVLNMLLRGRWHHRNFGFFNHGALCLMAADGVHQVIMGKRILAKELSGFIDRALN